MVDLPESYRRALRRLSRGDVMVGQLPPITEFRGEHRYLSDFYISPFRLDVYEVLLRVAPRSYSDGLTPVELRGEREWAAVEYPFQVAKVHGTPDAGGVERFGTAADQIQRIVEAKNPSDAKRLGGPPGKGGMVQLRPDWDRIKVPVMLACLRAKFARPDSDLALRLVATSPRVLIEGNTWDDTYWGATPRSGGVFAGKNMLGRCLMLVRQELNVALAAGIPVEEVRRGR